MVHPLKSFRCCSIILILISSLLPAPLASGQIPKPGFAKSDALDRMVRDTITATVEKFGALGLSKDKIALTLIDMNDRLHPAMASHRGQEPIYPASVVKLFYFVAAHHQMETGALRSTPEIERALRDMIVDSSNDATHFILDTLTGATAGPELEPQALAEWMNKRN
ncbi:MAG TPA: hypothetical protein VID27_21965, partial [Blastocatellia bacterium]